MLMHLQNYTTSMEKLSLYKAEVLRKQWMLEVSEGYTMQEVIDLTQSDSCFDSPLQCGQKEASSTGAVSPMKAFA